MKQGKYISGERGVFKVAKVNLPLSDGRLRLFLERKEDWLKEGLLMPAKKKNKRGRIIGEGSPWHKKKVPNKIMCHHLEEFPHRRVTTVVYQCKHGGVVQPYPPPNFVVPNIAFAEPYAHLPQPQHSVSIIGGYVV
jgi:hypothetical protein